MFDVHASYHLVRLGRALVGFVQGRERPDGIVVAEDGLE